MRTLHNTTDSVPHAMALWHYTALSSTALQPLVLLMFDSFTTKKRMETRTDNVLDTIGSHPRNNNQEHNKGKGGQHSTETKHEHQIGTHSRNDTTKAKADNIQPKLNTSQNQKPPKSPNPPILTCKQTTWTQACNVNSCVNSTSSFFLLPFPYLLVHPPKYM